MSYESETEFWENYLQNSQVISYVTALQDEQVVGFVMAGPSHLDIEEYKGEVTALYVRETFQRKGIGRKLLFLAINTLKRQNLHPIIIQVLKENPYHTFYAINQKII